VLSQADKERRRKFITATDAVALIGASPWANAGDIFIQKTQGVDTFKGNEATDAGSRLEDVVLAWAAERLGPLNPGDWCVHENGINACTLDSTTVERDVVEAKTSGIVGPGTPQQWGEDGTDEVPDHVLVQVQAQLLVTGARRAFIPALIGGRGFAMFKVQANIDLQVAIREVSEQFWTEHVLTQTPPEDFRPSLASLRAMRRVPEKVVDVPDEVAQRYLQAKEEEAAAKEATEIALAELLTSLGDAEGAKWSGGEFSYLEQTRKAHQVKESTFRVLRHKAAKVKLSSATIRERIATVESGLFAAGYRLKEESESGSRYYVAIGRPDIRVSDHEANAATSAWMSRVGALEVRVDGANVAESLMHVLSQVSSAEVLTHVE
jgi:putative phage-type endonuclease